MCGGDSDTCFDCKGIVAGTSTYDRCDICGGNNECLDCLGEVCGLAAYDECDVCDGDGTSCYDCDGVKHGPKVLDRCNRCVDPTETSSSSSSSSSSSDSSDSDDPTTNPNSVPCDEEDVDESLENRISLYITLFVLVLISCFIMALLCNTRFGPYLVAIFFSLFASCLRTQRTVINNTVRPRRAVVGGMPKTIVFAVTVLALLSHCEAFSLKANFHAEICLYTNIASLFPGSCSSLGQDPCAVWPPEIITCFPSGAREIQHVKFDALNPTLQPFGGVIFSIDMMESLQVAETIAFRGRTDTPPITTEPSLRQLTFFDFDAIPFNLFGNNLKSLRICTSHFGLAGLPFTMFGLSSLTHLSITDSDLGGTIPDGLCSATTLQVIELIGVQLQGAVICPNYNQLSNLNILDLRNNQLVGDLPDWSMMDMLVDILLDNNKLTGLLNALSMPPNLQNLFMRHNQFTTVSQDWTSRTLINKFAISFNQFTGLIPKLDLPNLLEYDISHNMFDGWGDSLYNLLNSIYLFDVSYNMLPDPLPAFSTTAFPLGNCHFEHNPICEPIALEILIQQCTYSLAPEECCTFMQPKCVDCGGQIGGDRVYDVCDICNGDGTLCIDCRGNLHGTARYDACDVCDGDSTTCYDCAGFPTAPYLITRTYDACDVCDGDSSTCGDCSGAPNGPYIYDACDVCTLPATRDLTCMDCAGVPHGTSVFDEFGVCNGDGTLHLSHLEHEIREGEWSFWLLAALFIFTVLSLCLLACSLASLTATLRMK